ncbi:MAG: hypothetical protein JW860_01595 [Sedimentisphaerales bacterium]|nr:hypothetical protein [Sedimentisphaerales bacterium]
MTNVEKIINLIDGWINPIMVKELRQAVQGKFIMAVLLFFLTISVAVLGFYSMTYDKELEDFEGGRTIFLIYLGILMGTCLLFVPGYTSSRLAAERADENVDLLFATAMKPAAIIRGKLLSAFILCILIYSACMPFMTLTYLLRGIDLPTIFILLALGLLAVLIGIQFSIFLACLPMSKWFKGLMALSGLFGLGLLMWTIMAASFMLLRFGIGSAIGSWAFLCVALSIAVLVIIAAGLLFVLSVAMITPSSANRALPIRIYLTAIWLFGGVIAAAWAIKGISECWPMIVWASVSAGIFSFSLLGAVSEREKLGLRVANTIPKRRWLRGPAFLFYSGGAGGVIWAMLMMFFTYVVLGFWHDIFPRMAGWKDMDIATQCITALCLYFIAYSLTGLCLRRFILGRLVKIPLTWGIVAGLIMTGAIGPLLVAFFAQQDIGYRQGHVWFLGNPFGAIAFYREVDLFITVGIAWAAGAILINLPWFYNQITRFKPPGETEFVA